MTYNNKIGQLRMFETVGILVVFFILLGISLIFYGGVQRSLIESKGEEQFQQQGVVLAQQIGFLPEVQCSFKGNLKGNCYDIYKLQSFAEYIQDEQAFLFYGRSFGASRIQVVEVYPPRFPRVEFTLYDNLPKDAAKQSSLFVPISIFNATRRYEAAFSFGYLNITVAEG